MPTLPVDVLWIARYDYPPGWGLKLHHHNYWQMIFFLDGNGVFTLDGASTAIRGGELALLRPGAEHGLSAESEVRTLDVKFRVAPGRLAQRLHRAARIAPWPEPGLAARFERIRGEGERKAPWYRELCAVLLTELLYLYLRHDPRATPLNDSAAAHLAPHDMVLQRALACIRDRSRQPLTVRAIAEAAGCSDRTLRLHFQHVLQTQPLEFLQRHRIAQAKELIQYSDYTLKEIAGLVGFQTVHHFTRLFTAAERRSPAAWRREYLEGIRKNVYINPRFENRIVTTGPRG